MENNDIESLSHGRMDEGLEEVPVEENVIPPYEEYRKYKVRYFICAFFLCPLILVPCLYVTFKYGLRTAFQYKLIEAVQQRAWKVVLARASLTACIILLTWTCSQTISVLIPYGQLRYRKNLKPATVRSLTALLQTRVYFFRALFLFSLLFISAKNLYDTTLLQNALEVVGKRFAGNMVVSQSEPPLAANSATLVFYLERVHICAVIFTIVFFLLKYLLNLILYSFHVTTFGRRIEIANRDTLVLADLYKTVSNEETRFLYGLQEQLNLSSEHRAATIAKALFESMAEGNETVSTKDLNEPAKKLLSPYTKTEEISLDDFVQSITGLYQERMNIRKSLKSNRHIMHKLDRMFSTVALIFSALLSTPFLDVGVTTLWAGFLALFTALGFALQSVGKTSFEAMLFIFVVHSFDIGDVIVIDGERYQVEHLEVFTSEFRKVEDGAVVYAPNSALSSKNITNISRTKREQRAMPINNKL